jgi:hypothetical protein
MSALYWTGGGMSINRVINGSTKKQPNKQGHNRVECLKIEKKTQMGDILNQATRAHNNRHIQQRPIEKNQEQTRTDHLRTHLPQRCGGIHIHNAPKSQQKMDETQDIPLSSLIDQSRLHTVNKDEIMLVQIIRTFNTESVLNVQSKPYMH